MINKVLDEAKKRLSIESDYALAKALGLKPQHISGYRKGGHLPDDSIALRLAEAAGMDPLQLLAQINAERAKDPKVKRFWKMIGTAAAAILAIFSVSILDVGSKASATDNGGQAIHYAKLRAWFRRLIGRDRMVKSTTDRLGGGDYPAGPNNNNRPASNDNVRPLRTGT